VAKNKSTRRKDAASNHQARIKVVGIGGGGGNALSRMREDFGVRGVEFIAINTDAQDLENCRARRRIHIGKNITRGLGTGMNPEVGRQAAEENRSEIVEALRGADLVFITAGLGGGTGSGGAPIVAEAAKEIGALAVSVVTKPFSFEGSQRAKIAEEAAGKLKERSDTLIIVPNDRIFSIIQKDTPILKAFSHIDDVLKNAVQGIAELIAMPGMINVDFADVKSVMEDAGSALVGIGIAGGQDRAVAAIEQAINSPLLELSIEGARGVLLAVSGGRDLAMSEINEIAQMVREAVDPDAKIIFGAYQDRRLAKGKFKVVLVATGFNGAIGSSGETNLPMSGLFSSPVEEKSKAIDSERQEDELVTGSNENVLLDVDEKKSKTVREDEKTKKAKQKKSDDIWDIPTFLRRKKKDK
jgi:cell division protein FtsZ